MKRQSSEERRKVPRFYVFIAMPTLKNINRVNGHEVTLINMSRRGALIESSEQMFPNTRIVLRAVTAETTCALEGRIVRCNISRKNDAMFQIGMEFDEEFTFLPESIESLESFEDDSDFLK